MRYLWREIQIVDEDVAKNKRKLRQFLNRKMVCISSERHRLKIFLVQMICILIRYYITNFQQPSLTFDFSCSILVHIT